MPVTSALPMAGLFAVAVLAFAGLSWLLTGAVGPLRHLRDAIPTSVLAAAIFSLLMLLYGAIASFFRDEAGIPRETYLPAVRAALWATYVVAAIASAGVGAAFARRGDRAKSAGATLLGLAIFMVIVLPLSEGIAECYANVTLVLRPSC